MNCGPRVEVVDSEESSRDDKHGGVEPLLQRSLRVCGCEACLECGPEHTACSEGGMSQGEHDDHPGLSPKNPVRSFRRLLHDNKRHIRPLAIVTIRACGEEDPKYSIRT